MTSDINIFGIIRELSSYFEKKSGLCTHKSRLYKVILINTQNCHDEVILIDTHYFLLF